MRRIHLPTRLQNLAVPAAFADPVSAKACQACARHDAPALVIEGISHAYGAAEPVLNDVSLCLHAGEIVSLVGPSGCGKTTTLRLVAGLERLQSGFIQVGMDLAATSSLNKPAEARNVGMMFQDYALFPHLTVQENVAFGLSHLKGADRMTRARNALRDVGLEEFADRNPGTLSGGQQQRVALARAVAPRPNVVLLDEPFSGLDAELRRKVRGDSIHLLKAAGAGALMVTHDPEEALFMSERIAVMRDGRIEQCGDPKELYDCPASPYVTRFFSEINELTGISRGGQVETSLGKVDAKGLADGCNALVMARPEHLLVGQAAVATGHSVEGQVNFARWLGRNAMVEIRLPSGEMIMARTPDQLPLEVGASLEVALDPTRAHCFARTDDKDNLPMINADHAERLALTASLG